MAPVPSSRSLPRPPSASLQVWASNQAGWGRLQGVNAGVGGALLELFCREAGVLLPEICIALRLPLKDGDKCLQETLEWGCSYLLIFSFLLPSHPAVGDPRREACWRERLQTHGGASALLPGVPRAGGGHQGMEPVSAEGSPLPSRPHARGAGREAFPPPSLPLRQWRENWVRQALSSCWLVGGGGGRTAVSPRPAEPRLGRGWGPGTRGLPHSNPHSRWGLRAAGPVLWLPLDAAQTCSYPGGKISINVHHLDSSPPGLHSWGRPHVPGPSHSGKPHSLCS